VTYIRKKGYKKGNTKVKKIDPEKFLSAEQVAQILDAVVRSDEPNKRRDHAAIYLGYHFGLRVGEACLLERDTFRHIDRGIAHIRTLKNIERIPYYCHNPECNRRRRVAAYRAGSEFPCAHCGTVNKVPVPHRVIDKNPPEKEPPIIESQVCDYVKDYLDNVMRPNQRWLFESSPSVHMSSRQLSRVFNTYLELAGLPSIYSWHALRHGRGVLIWERFQDPVMVRDMLRQKSISSAEIYMHMSPQRIEEARQKLSHGSIAANPFSKK